MIKMTARTNDKKEIQHLSNTYCIIDSLKSPREHLLCQCNAQERAFCILAPYYCKTERE